MLELPILTGFMLSYGYLAVFVGVILGGEILLLVAGFLAAQDYFSVYWVVFFATLGIVLMDIVWYIVGRFGRKSIPKWLKRFLIGTKERSSDINRLLKKHAGKTIFLVRFIYGLRAMILVLAGVIRMNFWKFLGLNVLGSIVWSIIMTLLGYFFGESFNILKKYVSSSLLLVTFVFVAIVIMFVIVVFVKKKAQGVVMKDR